MEQELLLCELTGNNSGTLVHKPAAKKEARVLVNSFLFEGNENLSAAFLMDLTSGYRFKTLSLAELQAVCASISAAYNARGFFLAQAIIPAQPVQDGIIRIVILEGTLGKVTIRGARLYRDGFIRRHFHPTVQGAIHQPSLIKSLLLLNENLGLHTKATIVKGAKPMTSDIILEVTEELPCDVFVDYNNFGSAYTARHRAGLEAHIGNFLLQGSDLGVRMVRGISGQTLGFGKASYRFFITDYGTHVEFSYLKSDFNVGKEFRAFDMGGKTNMYGAGLAHPLIRTRRTEMDLRFGFDFEDSKSTLLGIINSDDKLNIASLSINYAHLDSFYGRNSLASALSEGIPGLGGALARRDPLASRVGAGGEFTKFNLDLKRIQQLPWSCFLLLNMSMQTSSDVLPVCEQFYIGGGNSVRGYESAQYLGDYGYTGSLELRTPLPLLALWKDPLEKYRQSPSAVQLAGFIDYGMVFLKNPQVGENRHTAITGAGPGIRLNIFGCNASIDWGFKVGENALSQKKSMLSVRFAKQLL
jgi:hemolysin activation/secretion protein